MARITEKGLIAKKIGMTRVISDEGKAIAVTLVKVEDQKVTKILTPDRDGYHGFQVGYFLKGEKNLNKPDLARLRKSGVDANFARFKEFRTAKAMDAFQVGVELKAEMFSDVSHVDVTGMTKGRGFQGAVKRWNSAISRMTHGSMYHRRTGSLGSNTTPGRVMKNKPMPGHMGVERKTIKNMQVVLVDAENNVIALKGSVPGTRDGYVEIRPTNSGN